MSISEKTPFVLFHSLTDEEMEPQDSDNGGGFKAQDLAMWKRSIDNEKHHMKKFLWDLGSTARDIIERGERIPEDILTNRVKEAHREFIIAAYTLDIILSILKPKVSSELWFGEPDMDNWLKGSAEIGLITVVTAEESLGVCCLLKQTPRTGATGATLPSSQS